MARKDFWASFLKGLYEGGFANPTVGRQRALEDLYIQQMQQQGVRR